MSRSYSNSDLRNRRFGRLTVLSYDVFDVRYCLVLCDCGIRKRARKDHLLEGRSTSCGCGRVRFPVERAATRRCWRAMISRCVNPKDQNYIRYGGRGIKVCERWLKFDNFLNDMGYRPSGDLSIERRDNSGNYEPSNCHWATKREQSFNTRRTRWLTFQSITLPAGEWADRLGITRTRLYTRLRRGWSVEEALTV